MAPQTKVRPKATSDVRSRVIKILANNTDSAKALDKALRNTAQNEQHKVDKNGWDGDVFNIKDMSKPWDRAEHDNDVRLAIKDVGSPGVVGDLITSTLQGDWLSTQERAFRARHSTKIRATMHASSRRYGHGHDGGLFNKGIPNYLKHLVKLSKDSRP